MSKGQKQKQNVGSSFIAYVFCGNRQIIRREVNASKRFMVNDDMYIIRPSCIFLKKVEGRTRSVSYYREGNPNPYDFVNKNTGISNTDLDRLYAEDFYHIVTDLTQDAKKLYILLISGINMGLTLVMGIMMYLG